MPINSKQKGKRGEREFIDYVKHLFPNAKRSGGLQAGKQGDSKEPDVLNVGPFWIECKLSGKPSPVNAYLQALEDSKTKNDNTIIPLAYVRQTLKKGQKGKLPGLVVLSIEDFIKIIENCNFIKSDHQTWCNHPDCTL